MPFNPGLIKAQLSDDLGNPAPYTNPAEGFMIFNDGDDQPHGFYYWEGTEWLRFLTAGAPDLTTKEATTITLTTATCGGIISDHGGVTASTVGICWSQNPQPTMADDLATQAYSTDDFSLNMTSLEGNQIYYVRAFAINDAGTKYGNQISFVTTEADNNTVTAPTNADAWYEQYTYEITWSDNIGDDVKIELLKNSSPIETIVGATESDGSYDWTLGTGYTPDDDYQIRITGTGGSSGVSDDSETFEIREPEFTITAPATNGTLLAEWVAGNAENIVWTSNLPENFKIELWRAGAMVEVVTASIPATAGTIEYNVPSDIEIYSDYELRFTSFTNENYEVISDPFRILGTMADTDGNEYNSIRIGDQLWMKQNLKTTSDANSIAIPNITDNAEWAALEDNNLDKAYCWYNNEVVNADIYGGLYTYATALDACPYGWHLPSDDEWDELTVTTLGGNSVAGGKMKAITLWNEPNTGATDESGFDAYGTGYRDYINEGTSFFYQNELGFWWSSNEVSEINSSKRALYNNNGTVNTDGNKRSNGFSIRCIADENTASGISTDAVGSVASNGATLYATVNPNNTTCKVYFNYGETDNNPSSEYGALYTYAADTNGDNSGTNVQGACPTGWHIPSDSEWSILTTYLGGESEAGGKLKETGTTHWSSPNTGATNESGFTALGNGYRSSVSSDFVNMFSSGIWRSSSENTGNSGTAWNMPLSFDDNDAILDHNAKGGGYSIRCVQD